MEPVQNIHSQWKGRTCALNLIHEATASYRTCKSVCANARLFDLYFKENIFRLRTEGTAIPSSSAVYYWELKCGWERYDAQRLQTMLQQRYPDKRVFLATTTDGFAPEARELGLTAES